MSGGPFFPAGHSGTQGNVDLAFAFTPDGANPPTIRTEDARYVKSIVHNSAGVFTVTLKDGLRFKKHRFVGLELLFATAVDLVAQLVAVDLAAAGTVKFRLLTGAIESDPPANAANAGSILMRVLAQNSANA